MWLESVFWKNKNLGISSCWRGTGKSFTPYVLRSTVVSPQPGWFEYAMPSTTARGYVSCEDEWMSGNAMEQGA